MSLFLRNRRTPRRCARLVFVGVLVVNRPLNLRQIRSRGRRESAAPTILPNGTPVILADESHWQGGKLWASAIPVVTNSCAWRRKPSTRSFWLRSNKVSIVLPSSRDPCSKSSRKFISLFLLRLKHPLCCRARSHSSVFALTNRLGNRLLNARNELSVCYCTVAPKTIGCCSRRARIVSARRASLIFVKKP